MSRSSQEIASNYDSFDFAKAPTPADHSFRILSCIKALADIGFVSPSSHPSSSPPS